MKKIYYVPIFGITGVGKSQLCNFLFKDLSNSKYKVGHSNKMQTTIKDLKNQDEKGLPILEDKFCLIDLPGGDDSKTDDLKNLENIAKFLQNKERVDCILLVFNFTTRNEEKSTKEYLKKLSCMFTPLEFFSHVIIILSNYPLKPRKSEVEKRETYMSEIKNLIIECFELKDRKEIEKKKLNYYFIDTLPDEDDHGNQFYTEIQSDTRDAIIKEMDLICSQKLFKIYNNLTINFLSYIDAIDKRYNINEHFYYLIRGSDKGKVWGSGIFTDDSNIAKAAVFEGKCKLGEEIFIKIKMIKGLSNYSSGYKNGIDTYSWENWYSSYIFVD